MNISYLVHLKHRAARPTRNASVWDISPWREISLFAKAGDRNWRSQGNDWMWSLEEDFSILGRGIATDGKKEVALHMSKFVLDSSLWHGYPVRARGDDIPPEHVLDDWLKCKIIDKADKAKIIGGQFR
jgi:hypothetical protein